MSNLNQSGVTQLEFHQAMNDFKHMFPEMEEDVIESVLRANNGVVDTTIDQLLQMNNESLKKKAAIKKDNVRAFYFIRYSYRITFCFLPIALQ